MTSTHFFTSFLCHTFLFQENSGSVRRDGIKAGSRVPAGKNAGGSLKFGGEYRYRGRQGQKAAAAGYQAFLRISTRPDRCVVKISCIYNLDRMLQLFPDLGSLARYYRLGTVGTGTGYSYQI